MGQLINRSRFIKLRNIFALAWQSGAWLILNCGIFELFKS